MTVQQINQERNEKGIFSTGNEVSGWYAISRDGIHMITYYQGKYKFSEKDDVIRWYSERGFAARVRQLMNRGY